MKSKMILKYLESLILQFGINLIYKYQTLFLILYPCLFFFFFGCWVGVIVLANCHSMTAYYKYKSTCQTQKLVRKPKRPHCSDPMAYGWYWVTNLSRDRLYWVPQQCQNWHFHTHCHPRVIDVIQKFHKISRPPLQKRHEPIHEDHPFPRFATSSLTSQNTPTL